MCVKQKDTDPIRCM